MTEKLNSGRYHDVLPEELDDCDISKAGWFLETVTPSGLENWAKSKTEILNYNGRDFNMVIDRSHVDSDKAVLVLSEFGSGIMPRFIAKSRVIRNMVDPEATLVIQPSATIGEANMNFSYAERKELRRGNLSPIVGRLAVAMAGINNPSDVTIFGPSQGAMVALAYAAHPDTPPAAVAVVETPNIVERSMFQIVRDFVTAGKDLSDVVKANFENHQAPLAVLAERDARIFPDVTKFMIKSLHPDNIAMVSAMRYPSASSDIKAILDKGGSVVQAWGDMDNVSPNDANQLIADKYQDNPRYDSLVLKGMSHAATDFYVLDGALARLAHELKN